MTTNNKNKTRKNNIRPHIEHHHLLLRLETELCPIKEDKELFKQKMKELVHEIDMKPLSEVQTFYMDKPKYNEGLTGIVVIQTSHMSFHFWKTPDKNILHNPHSRCLLQADIYTCGKLSGTQISKILRKLEDYKISHANITLLNRKTDLHVDKVESWDMDSNLKWLDWIKQRF